MTSSPASRADQHSADNAAAMAASEPPSDAVTLSDLIADVGPLPVDAALECLQRVAERLEHRGRQPGCSLAPSRILIDDNGEIWLDSAASDSQATSSAEQPNRESLDGLGRLLLYLTTANSSHLDGEIEPISAGLPGPVSRFARRLSSADGRGYVSYAALAAEAAGLRESREKGENRPEDDAKADPTDGDGENVSLGRETSASDLERPRDEAESLDVATAAPVETLVPADVDESESKTVAGDVPAASSSGRAMWLAAGLLVLILIGALFWWIGV